MNVEQSKQLINNSQNEFFSLIYPERIVLGWADILTGFTISGALNSDEIELTLVPLACLLLVATIMSGGGAILARISSVDRNVTGHSEIGKPKQSDYKNSIATGIILSCLTLLVALMVSPWTAFLAFAIALIGISILLWQLFSPKTSGNLPKILKGSIQTNCTKCRFFNDNTYLKCAVQPTKVLKKEAQECLDYESTSSTPEENT